MNGITNGDGYILNDMIYRFRITYRYFTKRYYERWRLYLKRYDIPLSILAVIGITYRYCTERYSNGDGYFFNGLIYRLAYSRSSVLHIGIVGLGLYRSCPSVGKAFILSFIPNPYSPK
jgi:hypothetical protein